MKIRKRIVIYHEKKLFLQKIASEQHSSLSETVTMGIESFYKSFEKVLEQIQESMRSSPSVMMIGEIIYPKELNEKLQEKISNTTQYTEVEDPPEIDFEHCSAQLKEYLKLLCLSNKKSVLNIYLGESEYARLQEFCNENNFRESNVLRSAVGVVISTFWRKKIAR